MALQNSMTSKVQPGGTYRFLVSSTEEAVRVIQDRLGDNAKVLSVRQIAGRGLAKWFSKPRLEVIAQAAEEAAPLSIQGSPNGDRLNLSSDEAAAPATLGSKTYVDESVAAAKSGEQPKSLAGTASRLPEILRKGGFSESMIGRLQLTQKLRDLESSPLHIALSEVGKVLRDSLAKKARVPLPARTAFLGTRGVGRTTALCKWIARDVFARRNVATVVKAEFDCPNPAEGLAVFCEALGVPTEHYSYTQGEDIGSVLGGDGARIYVDLPGLSLKGQAENKGIAEFLERERIEGRVLVLNASYDLAMLRRAYAVGRDLGATHLVLTHMDELEHWGKLWDFLIEGELSLLFLANGPSLSGDCDEEVIDALMRKTLPGA